MKHYAAFLEGLTPLQEEQLTCILFNQLCIHLTVNQKKSKPISIDNTNEKIWQQEKLFFHYNKNTRLLETECVKHSQAALVTISKKIGLDKLCSDFFKNLKFATSEAEALMLGDNGFLFSQSIRTYESKNSKNLPLFNGIVSSSFAIQQILTCNSGLVLGHVHNDTSSYAELISLLLTCKFQEIKILYLELPYRVFSPLLEDFNKKKSDHRLIISELKKGASKLYQDKTFLKHFGKLLLAARNHGIAIQACDVNSLNFLNQTEQILDKEHRLKVGNACMIRSIEALQFKQHHPKFLLLVGLAHAHTIAQELGVPCCYIGDKKTVQDFSDLAYFMDYEFFAGSGSLRASKSNFFMKIGSQLDQTSDPKINEIIIHWDELIKKIPRFSSIPVREIEAAREIYVEYVLEKSHGNNRKISDICKTQQSLIIELLTQAVYSKFIELAHPKNWYPLFYCQRPYGIRLADNEKYAFTLTHLNALETSQAEAETVSKLHYA
ncbi:hypothetical protein [Rickettsiella endosymbiont of Miltochrista miniata]|uniref:hypothetical protein n=1 Tax=Rickettsiella endosymbiont of Miltochrista miniata TaxID=3066239 RepID=UPI00313D979E